MKSYFERGCQILRTDKENYYLDIAETVSERGTCLRRNFRAIIVNHDEIVSTGTMARREANGKIVSTPVFVFRKKLGIPRGEHEVCAAPYAEANAIISAARKNMLGAAA